MVVWPFVSACMLANQRTLKDVDLIVAKVQQHTLDMYKYVQALQVVSADFKYRYDAQLQNMELMGLPQVYARDTHWYELIKNLYYSAGIYEQIYKSQKSFLNENKHM